MLVAKPRGDAPHEGGARFARGSLSDDILVRWIREGAPGDLQDTNQVVAVRLVPDKLVLKPGQKHRLQFLADYSDGSTRDVTRLGVLSANNNQYADIDDEAMVTAGDTGETAIVGRFERTFAATSVMVVKPEAKFAAAPVPQDHFVDRHIVDKLNRLKITASAPAGDEEFLRRVYIDLIGIQPRPEEIKEFLADKNPKKRETTIVSVPRVSARSGGVEHADGRVRPQDPDVEGGHPGGPGQRLLRDQQGHERHGRTCHAGLLRRAHAVRPLPRPSARELDAGRLLRPGQLLQPGVDAHRWPLSAGSEQQVRAGQPGSGGRRQSAHGQGAGAEVPGATSSIAASSSRSTTSAARTRPSTRPCSTP
jgi:hypothetical protein